VFNDLIAHNGGEAFIFEREGISEVVLFHIKMGFSLFCSLHGIFGAFQTNAGDAKLIATLNEEAESTPDIKDKTGFAFSNAASKQFPGIVPIVVGVASFIQLFVIDAGYFLHDFIRVF
jgi:hypothetical protein